MELVHYVISGKGSKSEVNEDTFSIPPSTKDIFTRSVVNKGYLYIVCDGMGGHQAGEEASKIGARQTAQNFYDSENILPDLQGIIALVNRVIYDKSQNIEELKGMGTTLTALLVRDDKASFYNVGDSRGYVYSQGSLRQITQDHSYVWEKYKQGMIKKDDIIKDPRKNMLTKAVGIEKDVTVDRFVIDLPGEFIFLLCTDGLTDFLTDSQIREIIAESPNLKDTAENLDEAARASGSDDDITIILVAKE